MAEHFRYSTDGDIGSILKNKLGIADQVDLDDLETLFLSTANEHFFDLLTKREINIDLSLLFNIHEYFLAPLYSWAGKLRTVDISKNGMLFDSSNHLDQSMKEFEKLFRKNIPVETDRKTEVATKLSLIHCELNAIHPFREGNGRTIRLFLDLIAYCAGYQPIDWSVASQKEYIHACVQGMAQEYQPMKKIIYAGLKK